MMLIRFGVVRRQRPLSDREGGRHRIRRRGMGGWPVHRCETDPYRKRMTNQSRTPNSIEGRGALLSEKLRFRRAIESRDCRLPLLGQTTLPEEDPSSSASVPGRADVVGSFSGRIPRFPSELSPNDGAGERLLPSRGLPAPSWRPLPLLP